MLWLANGPTISLQPQSLDGSDRRINRIPLHLPVNSSPPPPPYSDLISDSGEIGMGSAGRLPFHAGWCQGEEKEAVGGKCRPVTPWHKWRRSTFPALLFIWFSSFILEFLSVSISPPPPSLPPNPPPAPPTLSPPPLLSMSLWYHCVPDPAYHSTIFHLKRGGGGAGGQKREGEGKAKSGGSIYWHHPWWLFLSSIQSSIEVAFKRHWSII